MSGAPTDITQPSPAAKVVNPLGVASSLGSSVEELRPTEATTHAAADTHHRQPSVGYLARGRGLSNAGIAAGGRKAHIPSPLTEDIAMPARTGSGTSTVNPTPRGLSSSVGFPPTLLEAELRRARSNASLEGPRRGSVDRSSTAPPPPPPQPAVQQITPMSIEATSALMSDITGVAAHRPLMSRDITSLATELGIVAPSNVSALPQQGSIAAASSSIVGQQAARMRAETHLGPEFSAVVQAVQASLLEQRRQSRTEETKQAPSSSETQPHTTVTMLHAAPSPSPVRAAPPDLPYDAGKQPMQFSSTGFDAFPPRPVNTAAPSAAAAAMDADATRGGGFGVADAAPRRSKLAACLCCLRDSHHQAAHARNARLPVSPHSDISVASCLVHMQRLVRWFIFRVLFRWRSFFTLVLIGLALLFLFVFPDHLLYENNVYKWLFLFGGTLLVLYPLDLLVWSIFGFAEWLVRLTHSSWLTDAMAFIVPARVHVSHMLAFVFALLLKTVIFNLQFSEEGDRVFVAACASLIFYKAASIVRNIVMQFVIIYMYRQRQKKPVADMLFYQEMLYRLTDPMSTEHPEREKPPTIAMLLLENNSFWSQARHIRMHDCEAYTVSGQKVRVDNVAALHEMAGSAFTRLYEHATRARRYELKESIMDCAVEHARRLNEAKRKRAVARQHDSKQILRRFIKDTWRRKASTRNNFSASTLSFKSKEPNTNTATAAATRQEPQSPDGVVTTPSPTVDVVQSPPASPAPLFDPWYVSPPSSVEDIPDVPDVERWKLLAAHLLKLQDHYGIIPKVYSHKPADVPTETDVQYSTTLGSNGIPPLAHLIEEIVGYELELADMAHTSRQVLRFNDIVHCFASEADCRIAFNTLDMDHNGEVSREEFASSLGIMFTNWHRVKSKLEHNGISGGIRIIGNVVFYIILLIVVLNLFGVSFNQAYVPLTTTLIAFGFAIGPTLQRIMDSIIFVLFIAPYDVGDKVSIPTINAGATMTVSNVFLLYTEFVDGTNKVIISRNADLISQNIFNLKRSGEIAFPTKLWITGPLAVETFNSVKTAIESYVAERSISWKPNVGAGIAVSDANRMEVNVTITHRATYQDPGRAYTEYGEYLLWLTQLVQGKGLKYVLPQQNLVLLDPSAAASIGNSIPRL